VWFAYWAGRRGKPLQRHWCALRGILQTDAHSSFSKLYEGGAIQEAPCMAHTRRKFYNLYEAHHLPITTETDPVPSTSFCDWALIEIVTPAA
jgi:hypothetical protein